MTVSYADPFLALSYVLILIVSWLFLDEQVTPLRVVGVCHLCRGVSCLPELTRERREVPGRTTGIHRVRGESVEIASVKPGDRSACWASLWQPVGGPSGVDEA